MDTTNMEDGMIKTWFEGIANGPSKKWSEHLDFNPDEELRVVFNDEQTAEA